MKSVKTYLLLHLLMLVYSFSPVCSKLAGQYPVLSLPFLFFYGLVLLILAVYAVLWQQIIKQMPLTNAYSNKAITVVWGMVWGVLLFGEVLSWQKLLGAAIIVLGILLYATSDRKDATTHA